MDLAQGLLIITSVHLLAAASPGPDFVLVSQQTLSNGKKAGLLCSIGIALGLSIHILYSTFGLAAVIANSTTALWAIKLLGGSYLIFLGIKGLRARSNAQPVVASQKTVTQRSATKTIGLGIPLQCTKPQSTDLLCFIVYRRNLGRYIGHSFGNLWYLDDGHSTGLVLTCYRSALITKGGQTSFRRGGYIIDRIAGGAMLLLGLKVLATRAN